MPRRPLLFGSYSSVGVLDRTHHVINDRRGERGDPARLKMALDQQFRSGDVRELNLSKMLELYFFMLGIGLNRVALRIVQQWKRFGGGKFLAACDG